VSVGQRNLPRRSFMMEKRDEEDIAVAADNVCGCYVYVFRCTADEHSVSDAEGEGFFLYIGTRMIKALLKRWLQRFR